MAYCSQLLNRLVEGFFGDTYDNGIVISQYLPFTFAENWTYRRALYNQHEKKKKFIPRNLCSPFSIGGCVMKELLPPATRTMMLDLKHAPRLLVHCFLSYLQSPASQSMIISSSEGKRILITSHTARTHRELTNSPQMCLQSFKNLMGCV